MFGAEAISWAIQEILQTYSLIRFVLVVGAEKEWLSPIRNDRLGEEGISPVQWAKVKSERFTTRKTRVPSTFFIKALSRLQNRQEWEDNQFGRELIEILKRLKRSKTNPSRGPFDEFAFQQHRGHDVLPEEDTMLHTSGGAEVPSTHHDTIFLDAQLISNNVAGYSLSKELSLLCLDAKGAGTISDFSFLVIRGIYDYSNSPKNQNWQACAEAAAAAYIKVLLGAVTTEDVIQEKLVLQSDAYEMDEEQAECHRMLKTSNYENYKDLNAIRVSNTCEWVLSHTEFKRWLQSSHELLWFSADPGCGKSVLSRFLIDQKLQSEEKHTVCYFFFKDNTEQDRLATALCALLHQLFNYRPQLLRLAMDAFRKNGEKLQNEIDELWRIFITAAKHNYSHWVICVLDGLDECREEDRTKLFQLLGSFYNAPKPAQGFQLKFLITSRPYLDIEYLFRELPSIRLAGEKCLDAICEDIKLVVKDGLRKLNLTSDVQDMLEHRLVRPANRTYLWVHLVLEDLRDPKHKKTRKGFEKALNSLPKSLEAEYDKILSRINLNRRYAAEILLRIVADAYRPLSLSELDVAFELATGGQDAQTLNDLDLGLDEDSTASRLRNLCGLFIYIDNSKIFLIHQSARDFLVNTHYPSLSIDSSWPYSQALKSPNELLIEICVHYLSLKDFNHSRLSTKSGDANKETTCSFLEYSGTYWAAHFRQATIHDENLLQRIYELYDDNSPRFETWYRIFRVANDFRGAPETALQLAAFNGHIRVVSHLLEVEELEKDKAYKNMHAALYWAALGGNEDIVNILIEKDMDVNTKLSAPFTTLNSECEKVEFMLLDSGADDISQSLPIASPEGYMWTIQLLVENCTNIDEQGNFYVDALKRVSAGYHKNDEQLSLDSQDVNAHCGFYGNALQAAAQGGHTKVVQLLLSRDADVNICGGFFGNALQAAARGGYTSISEILLDRGANINAPGGFYGNCLQAAARGDHKTTIEHLINRGADVNASGGFYGTALQAAARLGHDQIVRLLISKNADINAKGGLYGTALQASAAGGCEEVTYILLEKGADIQARGGFYGDSLEAATRADHVRIVQLLLEKGFNDDRNVHRHPRHGQPFGSSSSTGADMVVDGTDLRARAGPATFDEGDEENLTQDHQPYDFHFAPPTHRGFDDTSRVKKRKFRR
ncbi:unnamed protein product [Clonostachys rosea]|uniref:NACHT domain-containing protein n=1 Tax=Bionectria ochroleuca TaxID=29856 RepID=A0ABY6V1G2_BIOOC|nr:unnamed protein product [Clonostachys rosea]